MDAKIRIRDLHKSFGAKQVLDGVNIDVAPAESLVIIGGSGTGKSVLLKHVIGLLRPDSGTVEVDGVAVERLGNREITEFRRKFGMSFQEGALFDSMTIWQNVAFPLQRLTKMSRQEIDERVRECLEMVRLEGVEEKLPSQLSGGMRKRAALARSLVLEPRALLYDEPTTGLDPVVGAKINHLIRELQRGLGVTSVVVTHDLKSAFFVADRIAFLHEGRIRFAGPPDEARASHDPFLREFLDAA